MPGWEGRLCEVSNDDCVGNRCRHGATCIDRYRKGKQNLGFKVIFLVMITMSASVQMDTEVHSAKRESFPVKLPLIFVCLVAPVWRMRAGEAITAPASPGMRDLTALWPGLPARQMVACASMVGSV